MEGRWPQGCWHPQMTQAPGQRCFPKRVGQRQNKSLTNKTKQNMPKQNTRKKTKTNKQTNKQTSKQANKQTNELTS